MSWFEDRIERYRPEDHWITDVEADVIQYGLMEDMLDEQIEIEIDLDLMKVQEVMNGGTITRSS